MDFYIICEKQAQAWLTQAYLCSLSLTAESHRLRYMNSKSSLLGEILRRDPPKYNPDTWKKGVL